MGTSHIRQRAGKPPRIVRAPKRSPAASEIVPDASEFADLETPSSPLVGYVILAMYKGGAVNKIVYEPDMGTDGLGTDMFWAMAQVGLAGLQATKQAERVFIREHNEAHDIQPDD